MRPNTVWLFAVLHRVFTWTWFNTNIKILAATIDVEILQDHKNKAYGGSGVGQDGFHGAQFILNCHYGVPGIRRNRLLMLTLLFPLRTLMFTSCCLGGFSFCHRILFFFKRATISQLSFCGFPNQHCVPLN